MENVQFATPLKGRTTVNLVAETGAIFSPSHTDIVCIFRTSVYVVSGRTYLPYLPDRLYAHNKIITICGSIGIVIFGYR